MTPRFSVMKTRPSGAKLIEVGWNRPPKPDRGFVETGQEPGRRNGPASHVAGSFGLSEHLLLRRLRWRRIDRTYWAGRHNHRSEQNHREECGPAAGGVATVPCHCDKCSTSVHVGNCRGCAVNRTSGRKRGVGLYFSSRGHRYSGCRPARPVQPCRPGLVRGDLRGADAGPGRGLGGHLGRSPHADPRPDRQRQDPRGLPLDARPAGSARRARHGPGSSPGPFASSTSRRSRR